MYGFVASQQVGHQHRVNLVQWLVMFCRCEHTLTNSVSEASALTTSARSFAAANDSLSQLHLPHFSEHLHAAINCFSHAIRVSAVHLLSFITVHLCVAQLLGQHAHTLWQHIFVFCCTTSLPHRYSVVTLLQLRCPIFSPLVTPVLCCLLPNGEVALWKPAVSSLIIV